MTRKKIHVLIIDDVERERYDLQNVLKHQLNDGHDFRVSTVAGFEECNILGVLQSNDVPDVILLDIINDATNERVGQTLVPDIIDASKGEIPIILITKRDKTPFAEAVDGVRNGAKDILFKGDQAATIRNRIASCVEESAKGRKDRLRRSIIVDVLCFLAIVAQVALSYWTNPALLSASYGFGALAIVVVGIALITIAQLKLKD